jgi:hypothetical protein
MPDGPDASGVRATAARAAAIGRDNLGLVITGDATQIFLGPYERLADSYLNPTFLYHNLDLDNFTGRAATLATIDAFLTKHDRGYVEIEGILGVGKTTLLAHLATQRGYPHHFVQLMPNRGDIGVAMRNLGSQLVTAWDLRDWAPMGALPTSASRPETFLEILDAACRRRDEERPSQPIVIVVDGLDEAGQPQAENPLGLPRRLPSGVFFVVAHRDVYVPLAVDPPKLPLVLGIEESRQDMKAFLRTAAKRPPIAAVLESHGPEAEDTFVETLLQKTGGLWLYLSYVLVEIEAGTRSPADVDNLPGGLWQYYELFWRDWQGAHADAWAGFHQPLLHTLGAAREPLSSNFLATLVGAANGIAVEQLVEDAWKPFLDIDDSGEKTRYGISQASFRAFLEGQVDDGMLNMAEKRLARRTAEATRRAHGRLADRYLVAWGGLDQGLPGLKDNNVASMDGGYGLRHLAEHLINSDRVDELHRLLWTGWESTDTPSDAPAGRVVNAWRQALENAGFLAVYLNDVANAWHLVAADVRRRLDEGRPAPQVSLELRYALLSASVSSMAANVPPALLVELCRGGRIGNAEALAYARRGPDSLSRVEALLALTELLEPRMLLEVLREALVSCRAIEDEQLRTGALALLATRVPTEWREEAEALAASVVDPFWHVAASRVVDELLGAGPAALLDLPAQDPGDTSWHDVNLALQHAVWVARAIRDRQTEALARLTARMPERPSGEELAEALADARLVPQDRWRAELLTAIAQRMPDGSARVQVLDEALASARAVGDSAQHADALAALARQLTTAGRLQEALGTAQSIKDAYRRTATLADLIDHLPPDLRDEALTGAARGLTAVGDMAQRARVLGHHPAVVRALAGDDGVVEETRRAVRHDHWRALVLTALLPTLEPRAAEPALAEAFAAAVRLEPGHDRADVLVRLAPALPSALIDRALELLNSVHEPDERAMAAGALAIRLVELGRGAEAVREVAAVEDGFGRAEAQAHVAEALARTDADGAALDAARVIAYPHWRAAALARCSAHAADTVLAERALAEALGTARGSTSPAAVAEALLLVAAEALPATASELLEEAREAARSVDQPHDRARGLARVVSSLAAAGRGEEALDLAREIGDEHWRAAALGAVAPHVGDATTANRIVAMAADLEDGLERAGAIVALLPALEAAPLPVLYSSWRTVLRLLGAQTRRDLLAALPALLPGLQRLGGGDAMVDAGDVVESVRRWWP